MYVWIIARGKYQAQYRNICPDAEKNNSTVRQNTKVFQ